MSPKVNELVFPINPPELKDGAGFFQRVDYLVRATQWLVLEALNTRYALEHLKIMTDALQAKLDANTAANVAALAAIGTEVAQLAAAIAALSTNVAPTQAQLDQLQASTDALTAATATLTADDPAGV